MTFYEIDPLVAALATDTRHFTLLRDCPPRSRIVFGDARLTLAEADAAAYDILVIDAFSSDAIPVHLLTREAIQGYLRVLDARGVLAIHVSNEYMDLEPLVSALAADLGLVARVRRDMSPDRQAMLSFAHAPSVWVVLSRNTEDLGAVGSDSAWVELRRSARVKPWTDDFSNIVSVIKWN
jgi:spermidine synthase